MANLKFLLTSTPSTKSAFEKPNLLKPNKETGNSTIPTQISQQTPIEIDPFASSIDNFI